VYIYIYTNYIKIYSSVLLH